MNALKELEQVLSSIHKSYGDIEWAIIQWGNPYDDENTMEKAIYDAQKSDVSSFKGKLSSIDYYEGFGEQYLYGVVVFKDNTWLEREEYDGSEWWRYKCTPRKEAWLKEEKLPDNLL